MKLRLLSMSLSLCLFMMIIGSSASSAQEVQPLDPEWLMQMYEEGWHKVQEGVLQRDTGGARLETFGYGEEGLQWLMQGYERQLTRLEEEYDASPSGDLAELISQIRERIDRLDGDLGAAASAESFDGNTPDACSLSFDATAFAGPQQSAQGVTATASAIWVSNCGFVGNTFAYAYAHAIDGTVETTVTRNDPQTGTSIQSNVSASANGAASCHAEAQAEVQAPGLNIFYQTPLEQSFDCRAVLQASITGPTAVTTDHYTSECADVTWTASVAGGTPGYSYSWYIGADTTVQSTSSTLTRNYCGTNGPVAVKVIVRDSGGQTDDATFTTNIQHVSAVAASVSGPATVTTDYYSSACADVTWTASATGGHPGGYTYGWYLGTDTTVQGTGNTFTQRYCSTTQSVEVKVVARDTDGHTNDAAFATGINYQGPIVPRITGPATITTTDSTPCADVTWTASATSSGHTGYSYDWYIGTVLQGSGATLTKRYCSASQSVTVRVVARASNDVHEDSATHTTTVTHSSNPLVASISGQPFILLGSARGCKDVTWTASATGGSPGYTYSWYIGTSTTVQGTDSTLTKRFCGEQVINVKVTARDTAGQTDDATYETRLAYTSIEPCPDSGGDVALCSPPPKEDA